MEPRRIAMLIFICVAAVPVCACGSQDLQPISDRSRRIEIPGVSILPPPGESWFLVPVSPREGIPADTIIRFSKRLRDVPPARPEDARLVLAGIIVEDSGEARSLTPSEFLQTFTGGDPHKDVGEMITRRQRLIGLDAALDVSIGATCVRYHRLTEITGQFPAFPDLVAITSTWGLYCSHPLWPQYHIDLTYQQVYAKGQEALPLDAESNAFLKSLVFTSMRPVAEPGPKAIKSSLLQAGVLAYQQQRWLEAEVSLQAALKGAEDLGPKNSVLAMTLYYLASTEQKLGRPADAERLFRRALDNFEAQSAVDDREVTKVYANALNDLAAIYASEAKQSTVPSVIQEKCEKADPLFRHALALREKALGPDHREVGNSLENLMFLNVDCKRWTEAEVAARRAVSFYERQRGPADQEVVYLLDGLAGIYLFQGRLAEAEVPLQRVLSSVEKAAGPTAVASKLEGYAGLLRSGGHEVEAKELEARAQAIRVEAAKRP